MTDTKVLVTGGCGRIGSRVIEELLGYGYAVRVFDVVKGDRLDVEYVVGDISDYDAIAGACVAIDHVIHLAAVPVENGQPRQLFESNVLGTFNVVDAAAQNGVRGFVFASTVSTYGLLHPSRPFAPAYFPVDEESPQIPDRNYGNMKIIGEKFLEAYSRGFDMDCVALRVATVMNPGIEHWLAVRDNIDNPEHVFLGGMTMRDFMWQYVHVLDVAQAFTAAIRYLDANAGFGFDAFNIGAEDCISTVPSMELIRRYFPDLPLLKNPALFAENPHRALYGIDKAQRVLGYQPRYSWRDQD